MPSSTPTPAERALAAAFYAPIGFGAQLVDDVPAAVKSARQQIAFARFIGKMAVDQGIKEFRQRLAPTPIESIVPLDTVTDEQVDDVADNTASSEVAGPEPAPSAAPASDSLALPDYDQLPASHIISKLEGLTPSELVAIEAYERGHRHRRTVLGKIAQVQEN